MHTHHHHGATGKRLLLSLLATVAFVVVEIVSGLKAHSLALLSDAGHNFTDALALLLAWFAFYIESRPASNTKTYGYQRAGVLAAFVNALTLVVLSGFIFYESYQRFLTPEPVAELIMLGVATTGLVVNVGIMLALHAASRHDLNIRSAFVHMLGDALGSVGIIIGAVFIHWTRYYWIDPLLSVLIGVLILWTAWGIIKESLNILLEGLPRGIQLDAVVAEVRLLPGVIDVHDVHIWSLASHTHALSCHVLIEDVPLSASESILHAVNELLARRFDITHTTVQFEHALCEISASGCGPNRHDSHE